MSSKQRTVEELTAENDRLRTELSVLRTMEQRFRASEERFRTFFDNAPIGKCMTAPDGRLMRVNRAFGEMLGYSLEEIQTVNFAAITHADDLAESVECVRCLLAGEQDDWTMEKRYLAKDGREVWTLVNTRLQRDQAGAPLHFLTHVQDITERKQAEVDRAKLSEDLQRSNRELEQFAYVASHDLQEPLRMVASYTQLLAQRYQGKLDEKADVYIGYAVDGARRMQGLISDLLAFSRVGTRAERRDPTACGEVVAEVLRGLEKAIEESGAVIEVGELPTVLADRSQLGQVFQNLIANAIKFRGDHPPHIEVSAQRSGEEWVFRVADDGIGIDPAFEDKIFVIFQRLHARDEYPGSGMGLAIVKKIIERHGGRITLKSVPGQGASFTFALPAAEVTA